jgi:hypothetical protein
MGPKSIGALKYPHSMRLGPRAGAGPNFANRPLMTMRTRSIPRARSTYATSGLGTSFLTGAVDCVDCVGSMDDAKDESEISEDEGNVQSNE